MLEASVIQLTGAFSLQVKNAAINIREEARSLHFKIWDCWADRKGIGMRKAIVYASVHHGNTEKIVKSIAEECQVDLIDAVKQSDADLSSYDMIGFASGIYFSKFHQSILKFAEKNLPDDKKVFLICTYGGSANYKSIEQILDKKHASVVENHVKY